MFLDFLWFNASDDGGTAKVTADDVLTRYGSTAEAAPRLAARVAELENDAYKLRSKVRQANEEMTALKERVPADGSHVLTAEEKKVWDAYVALGAPADVATTITAAKDATTKLASYERRDLLGEAAKRTTIDAKAIRADVLQKLPGIDALEIKLKDAAGDVPASAVVIANGKEQPLADYLKVTHTDFLPSLLANSDGRNGVPFPKQANNGERAPTIDPVEGHINSRYADPRGKKD